MLLAALLAVGLCAAAVAAPTAYLHAAYRESTSGCWATLTTGGCSYWETTTFVKRASWLPGPERLPGEAGAEPLPHLLWRGDKIWERIRRKRPR